MKIFVDFDDTLAMSSATVVAYLNMRYGLSKTVDDVHDWCFRSIYSGMTPAITEAIFAGDYFWENIKLFPKAVGVLAGHDVTVCSCGNDDNLKHKGDFVDKLGYKKAFVNTQHGNKNSRHKAEFDMAGAIQIDDRVDSLLYTNAAVKVLFKNNNNHTWQKVPAGSDIYVANTWDEIEEIVGWFSDN